MTEFNIVTITVLAIFFLIISNGVEFVNPFAEWFWYLIVFPFIVIVGRIEFQFLDEWKEQKKKGISIISTPPAGDH